LTLQTLLQNPLCLDKSTIYKVFEPIFGIGLLTAPGKIYLNIKQKYVYVKYTYLIVWNCLVISKFSGVKSQNV